MIVSLIWFPFLELTDWIKTDVEFCFWFSRGEMGLVVF